MQHENRTGCTVRVAVGQGPAKPVVAVQHLRLGTGEEDVDDSKGFVKFDSIQVVVGKTCFL